LVLQYDSKGLNQYFFTVAPAANYDVNQHLIKLSKFLLHVYLWV